MFNLFKGGVKDTKAERIIDIEDLEMYIRNNPRKEEIQQLRSLTYLSKEYKRAKEKLPYITPHGTFNGKRADNYLLKLSGYIYFDVDAKDMNCDIDTMKKKIIGLYGSYVSMLGVSIGGKGIFFYVKVKNADKLTSNNFVSVHEYLRTNVFYEIPIDKKVKDISRPQFLTYDNELYTNNKVGITLSNDIFNNNIIKDEKCEKGCIKLNTNQCNTTLFTLPTFIDISVLFDKWIFRTPYKYTSLADYVIDPIEIHKVFIPKYIPEGKRHKIFLAMINNIMFLNYDKAGVTMLELQSFINYFNNRNTLGNPLGMRDMLSMVERAYNKIIEDGGVNVKGKIKYVHTDPDLPKQVRHKIGCLAFAKMVVENSIDKIRLAIQILEAQEVKVTKRAVLKLIENRKEEGCKGISYRTILTHWEAANADNTEDILKDEGDYIIEPGAPVKTKHIDYDNMTAEELGLPSWENYRKRPFLTQQQLRNEWVKLQIDKIEELKLETA